VPAQRSGYPAILTFLSVVLGLAGCVRPPMLPHVLDLPAQTLSVPDAPPVRDGRARFRDIFCALSEPGEPGQTSALACDRVLLRMNDEPARPRQPLPSPAADQAPRLLLVPGLFNECASHWVGFYSDAIEQLRHRGYQVEVVPVDSRSGSIHNARQIADYLGSLEHDASGPVVLVGHSKGTVDILEFLVGYPAQAQRVMAVISVAGAVNGSPLADWIVSRGLGIEAFVADALCDPGDRGALQSLTRAVRLTWLARHPLPSSVRYYSLAAFTNPDDVIWPLRHAYGQLAEIDPRNDGLLLFFDQVIPGSDFLGYLNVDHWRVAYPVETVIPLLGDDETMRAFPRGVVLEAALLYVLEAEAGDGP